MPSLPDPIGVIAPMPVMKTRLAIALLRELLHACERAARDRLDEEITDDALAEPAAQKRSDILVEVVSDSHARSSCMRRERPRDRHPFRPAGQVLELDARCRRVERDARGPAHRYPISARCHFDVALVSVLAKHLHPTVVREYRRPRGDVLCELVDRLHRGGDVDRPFEMHHAIRPRSERALSAVRAGTAPASAANTDSACEGSRRTARSARSRSGWMRMTVSTAAASIVRGRTARRRAAA